MVRMPLYMQRKIHSNASKCIWYKKVVRRKQKTFDGELHFFKNYLLKESGSHIIKSTTVKYSFKFFLEKLTFLKKKNNSPSKFLKYFVPKDSNPDWYIKMNLRVRPISDL